MLLIFRNKGTGHSIDGGNGSQLRVASNEMGGKKQQIGESSDLPDLKLKRPGFGRAQVLDQLIQGQFNRSMTTA